MNKLYLFPVVALFATTAYSVDGFAMDFCCKPKSEDAFETTKTTHRLLTPQVSYTEEEVAVNFMKQVISLHQDGVISGLSEETELSLNKKTADRLLENLAKQAIKKTDLKASLRHSEKKRNLNTSFLTMPMIQESFILDNLEEFDNEESKKNQ